MFAIDWRIYTNLLSASWLMQFYSDRVDNTKAEASTFDSKEDVWILRSTCCDKFPISINQLCTDQLIHSQPIKWRRQSPSTSDHPTKNPNRFTRTSNNFPVNFGTESVQTLSIIDFIPKVCSKT